MNESVKSHNSFVSDSNNSKLNNSKKLNFNFSIKNKISTKLNLTSTSLESTTDKFYNEFLQNKVAHLESKLSKESKNYISDNIKNKLSINSTSSTSIKDDCKNSY